LKIGFITLGCKVNQYETDIMKQELTENGHLIVSDHEEADLFIVNTCTVTNEADRKSRQMIRRLKRINENSLVIATGCLAQVDSNQLLDIADLVIDNGKKDSIVNIVNNFVNGYFKDKFEKAYWLNRTLNKELKHSDDRTRAFIMIEEGCDRCCTYCKIFHARGTVINSKPMDTILREINHIKETGIKEVVLTGINLGKYEYNGNNLRDVLEEIKNNIDGVRIRLSSIDPDHLNEKMYEVLSDKKFCRHLHLSIQSGSDNVLKNMNRIYTAQRVRDVAENLRNIDDNFSITTDIIVGFPGETESDFINTCDLIKTIEPLKVHIFKYSPKSNTIAAKMQNQITFSVKKERSKILNEITNKASSDFRNRFIGKNTEVLIETVEGSVSGHDQYYLNHIIMNSEDEIIGEMKRVIIKEIDINENDKVVSYIDKLS